MSEILVSVCSPVHNEQDNIPELIERMRKAMNPEFAGRWEFVLVNDGSSDNSLALLEEFAREDPSIRVFSHDRNRGERSGWLTAYREARGDVIAVLAADLQPLPEAVPLLVNAVLKDGYDVGTGARQRRQDGFYYTFNTFFFSLFQRLFFDLEVRDVSSNFLATRRELVRHMRMIKNDHRYILPILRRRGAKIKEIEVEHHARKAGHTHYSKWKILPAIPQTLMFMVRLFTGYYDLPDEYGVTLFQAPEKKSDGQ